jgi:glucokinase
MNTRAAARPARAVAALDLGGTKLAAAYFAADGRPRARHVTALRGREGPAVGALMGREARRLRRAAAAGGLRVDAIGVAVPGIAHAASGRVWAPNIRGWDDYPVRQELEAAAGMPAVAVAVDSDRAASILGEAWRGAARGCRHAVFLAVGTGIGAGILADGQVLRGANDSAGAAGWLALSRPFQAEYSACGDFEYHASGEGLARAAERLLAQTAGYQGPLNRKRTLSARDVFAAYEAGDILAARVMRDAIEYWGAACANLVSLLNPEKIIIGGGVFGPAAKFLDAIAAEARRWGQPVATGQVTFEASRLGGDAALYGAAVLARRAWRDGRKG